jgi:predicted lipoprotein with Yx(FWY)xxD motif
MVNPARTGAIVALCATAALSLAACGGGSGRSGTVSAAASAAASAAEANAGLLNFTNGTAKANNAPADTGDFFTGPSNSPAAMKWVQLSASSAGALNPVVVNGAGFTLYRFDKDSPSPSKSNCNGACAVTWPPVLVDPNGRIFLDGVPRSEVGVVRRADGNLQVTIGGWPVYRFSSDTAPGQTNGQGVDGTWFGVTPNGMKAGQSPEGTSPATGLDYQNGTATQNNAPADTGDFAPSRTSAAAMKWVQLTSGSANGLNPIVHDGAGFTLYRFDKDSPSPSKSNCNGACAVTWPPVLVNPHGRIFVNGVPTSEIGVVRRAGGALQVTIGGWPVYRFSKDTGPGQTNGEGVEGTWFAVSPQGQKVLPAVAANSSQPSASPSSTVALGNGSVILDSGPNFTEPTGSVGEAGPGCQTLGSPFSAKSLQLAGGPIKIWSGSGCTGTSAVVTDSTADLSTIGFNQPIASVRFGS